MAGAVEKKKVKRNTDLEEFEAQSTWGGAQRDMAVLRQRLGCDHDVSELYSPPRVVKMARELGMKGGVSLDPSFPAHDGYVWDFSRKQCRDRALQIVNEKRSLFFMMSAECTPYSNIPNLNMRTPAGKASAELAKRRGDVFFQILHDFGSTADGKGADTS